MKVAVVGAGIVGLFTAWWLNREGATTTVFDPGPPGAASVHAAGIIEPTRACRTNTLAFLRRVGRYLRRGTCAVRSADPRWLLESVRWLERSPMPGAEVRLRDLATESIRAYREMATSADDFGYRLDGLLERYDDPSHFTEERRLAESARDVPCEVQERSDGSGDLFFPSVGWLDTDRCVSRLVRELAGTEFVARKVHRVDSDGAVRTPDGTVRFDATVVTSGVTSRKIGVPLTGVRGFGWHVRTRSPPSVATIFVDRGVAIVPGASSVKATGGWDFDLSSRVGRAESVLRTVRTAVAVDEVLDFQHGSRPCTPDGLPTVGRQDRLVVANGGFRLGWSFAPGMGRSAAELALGRAENDRFLARFCTGLRSGPLL